MVDVGKYEKRLKQLLQGLDARLKATEQELEQKHDKDPEEDATIHERDEVLEDLEDMGASEIRAIHAALERIKLGVYGKCVSCGADISEARLDLLPETPFCKDCAPQ